MSTKYNLKIERLPIENLEFDDDDELPIAQPEPLVTIFNHQTPISLKPKPQPKPSQQKPQPKPQQRFPSSVDLRPNMSPVYDQGELGSCTANALCAAFDYTRCGFMGSRLFLYYNERLLDNVVSQDAGATLHDGIKCLKKYGLCSETDWPYDITQFAVKPPEQCYINALSERAVKVKNIRNTMVGMKRSLVAGFPFVVGIAIYSSFESEEVAKSGIVPMPTINDSFLGGHAVLVCGYDDIKQWWILKNSWGTSWGAEGYFYLPYAYLINSKLSTDLWNIQTVSLVPRKYNLTLTPIPEKEQRLMALPLMTKLPVTVDFRTVHSSKMTPVYDQEEIGSCVANSLCAAYSFNSSIRFLGSRLFLYYNARLQQGDKRTPNGEIKADSGSTLITGIKSLGKYGVCSETNWPYIINKYSLRPSNISYTEALSYKQTGYYNVKQSLGAIQTCLASGYPIVLGYKVFASFESKNTLMTGYAPMPYLPPRGRGEQFLGGHAVLVCGYDLTKSYPANPLGVPGGTGVWIIKNSWGTSVGHNGYFYLPLPYLTNKNLTIELWCISSVSK